MPATGQVADEQASRLAGGRAGEQVPFAGLLPGSLRVDRLVGRLRVDGDAVRRGGEHEQLRPAVAIDVVGDGIDRQLVDRHLAVGPVGRQRQFVGTIGIAGGVAFPFGLRQPAVEIEPRLPRVDHDHVVTPVGAEIGDDQPVGTPLERDHPQGLPAVERPVRGAARGAGGGHDREQGRGTMKQEAVHAAKNTPTADRPPRSRHRVIPAPVIPAPVIPVPGASARRGRPRGASPGPWPRSAAPAPWSRRAPSRLL